VGIDDEVKRAVFLDRDGVLNAAVVKDGKPYPPDSAAEMQILPGVRDATDRLHAAGFVLVVVTNQPDVARGKQTAAEVDAIHAKLRAELPALDAVYSCTHDDADHCECRKPKPGMLVTAATQLGISLSDSFMVGDRWRDIEAGDAAGCRSLFIDRDYRERKPETAIHVGDLPEAAAWILEQPR
jgi:D-glycero-D-manno-heptose 1,7-bisphosphate phosphatase